jgi:hypothetical protein
MIEDLTSLRSLWMFQGLFSSQLPQLRLESLQKTIFSYQENWRPYDDDNQTPAAGAGPEQYAVGSAAGPERTG